MERVPRTRSITGRWWNVFPEHAPSPSVLWTKWSLAEMITRVLPYRSHQLCAVCSTNRSLKHIKHTSHIWFECRFPNDAVITPVQSAEHIRVCLPAHPLPPQQTMYDEMRCKLFRIRFSLDTIVAHVHIYIYMKIINLNRIHVNIQ